MILNESPAEPYITTGPVLKYNNATLKNQYTSSVSRSALRSPKSIAASMQ